MIFNCPRCDYSTSSKNSILRHINKKNNCELSKNGLDIDIKKYEDIILYKANPLDIIKIYEEINNLRRENETLKTQLKITNGDVTFNGDNNIYMNNSNNINIQFTINAFNNPNTAYILSKHCDAALKNGNLVEGCIQMARLIWFNGNHPENHSIFKTNQKNKNIKCLEDGRVNEYTLNSKFKNIMEVVLDVFERSEKESEKYYDLNDMFDNPDKYPEFYKRLENDLSNELYNHKELVKETIAKFQHNQN